MKKLTRAAALVMALALCLALAACGGGDAKTIDINVLAEEIVNASTFGEEMNRLDSSVALGIYGCAEGTSVAAYAGAMATAEEVAVFEAHDSEEVAAIYQALETHLAQQKEALPEEADLLDRAIIWYFDTYVALCVTDDTEAAKAAFTTYGGSIAPLIEAPAA